MQQLRYRCSHKLKNLNIFCILCKRISSSSFINKDFPSIARTLFPCLQHIFERTNEYRWAIKSWSGGGIKQEAVSDADMVSETRLSPKFL